MPDFARKGGIAGFVIENDRVKIEINVNESKRAGLKIGAKLLEVARLIK
ncbi:MAG TPA: YfiR family protein [Candidatus Wallbacteria bacterium]|nr:YfiR family protein [Candidatus Wallbacteria bacterium]